MLNYESFREVVAERFMDYLPEKYQDMTLRIEPVNKINKVFDSIILIDNDEDRNTSPSICINHMYEYYLLTEDLQEVLQRAAKAMEDVFMEFPKVYNFDFDSARDNIVFQVINTLQNEEMLKEMPHREFLDLSIIYRWVVQVDENGFQCCFVYNDLAAKLGMNEGQLFRYAVENTRRILQPTVKSMNDVIRKMLMADVALEEIIDMMIGNIPEVNMLWVIGNKKEFCGAGSILYEDILHELATKLESNLYILPATMHECIAVSADAGDPDMLAEMVNDTNIAAVPLDERLSNQVYFYDKDARRLSLATDTPFKRLDGVIS